MTNHLINTLDDEILVSHAIDGLLDPTPALVQRLARITLEYGGRPDAEELEDLLAQAHENGREDAWCAAQDMRERWEAMLKLGMFTPHTTT